MFASPATGDPIGAAAPEDQSMADAVERSPVQKMTLPTLTAMVIGGRVEAGIFSLPARF